MEDTYDRIYCRECGKIGAFLTKKHLASHNLTKEQYQSKGYPDEIDDLSLWKAKHLTVQANQQPSSLLAEKGNEKVQRLEDEVASQ
jgi:hypothetical protein